MNRFVDLLREPSLRELNVDGAGRLDVHGRILTGKRMLRDVFIEFHHRFDELDNSYFSGEGIRLEIGAGVAPMRDTFPDVLATDVVASGSLDRQLDAQAMDLQPQSVRAVFGQNCFHHLSKPALFFGELERILVPGGGAILLEPYHGPLASFLFKRLFNTEGFDKNYGSWETSSTGPMNGANQALSYIVFERDRTLFEEKFPNLEIAHQERCSNYLKYLLSGGLNFRQLAPDWTGPIITGTQWLLTPLDRWLSLHHIVVLRKPA